MQIRPVWVAVAGIFISGAVVVAADNTNTPSPTAGNTAEATTPETTTPTRVRLPKEYNQLTNLTDEEKTKILAIREKTDQDIAALRKKEDADMKAELTDEQRAQLDTLASTSKQETRSKRTEQRLQERVMTDQEKLDAMKKASDTPATLPSGK